MKPGGLAILLGGGKPKSKEPDGDEVEAKDDGDDFDAAAQGVFDALKSGDLERFKTELRSAVMACSEEY